MKIGDKISDMICIDQNSEQIKLSDLAGKYVVLYFYPKDNTPGCTMQAQNFRDKIDHFDNLNAVVIGVSRDGCIKHQKFITKYELPFKLIADVEGTLCMQFGALVQKSMFGKKYIGIDRSTFIIDPDGYLVAQWREVKVKGHVDAVLKVLENMNNK